VRHECHIKVLVIVECAEFAAGWIEGNDANGAFWIVFVETDEAVI
jgi:hypothetical protein